MRKRLALIFTALAFVIFVPSALAVSKYEPVSKLVSLKSGEVVDGNYYAFGEMVEIMGTVNGDVYAAGSQVLVNATINGDLIVAGGTVNISGNITEDLRAAGGQITIDAKVGKNASVAGGNIDLTQSASIGKAAQLAGGNVLLSAPVTSEVFLAAGNATVTSTIGENLTARTGNLRLSPGASIAGNLDYWSGEELTFSNEASVSGAITRHELPEKLTPSEKQVSGFFKGFSLFSALTSIFSTIALGFILIKFFPNCTEAAILALKSNPWKALGIGLLFVIVTPIAILVLFVTMVGIPLALMSIPLFFIYIYFARIYAVLTAGSFLLTKSGKTPTPTLSLLTGIVIYYALGIIPFIGGLSKLFFILAGVGAGILKAKETYLAARSEKIF